jgi:hypothetical protein
VSLDDSYASPYSQQPRFPHSRGTVGSAGRVSEPMCQRDGKPIAAPDYGFTIDYPASMEFRPSHPDRNCDITSVACFYFDGSEDVGAKGTNLSGASLSVNVLRDRRTEQDCERIDNPLQPLKTETINGRTFRYGITIDGWTSHSQRIPTYRAFHQNVCFEIAVGVEKVSTGAFDPGAIKEFD